MYVFTYVAQVTRDGRIKGMRYPLTRNAAIKAWQGLRLRADIKDLRFHDLRHDVATKLLRETGNLELVRRALNHRDIATTRRYAHVTDDDVAEGLERMQESRKSPRTPLREVG